MEQINFWARETEPDVALNISEMLSKNFGAAISHPANGWHASLDANLQNINVDHGYFHYP